MDLTRQILGAYCERTGPYFWAEPVNAMTNVAFIVASLLAIGLAAREDRLDGPVLWLSINAFVVGVGSFLFHTLATVWAALADTGPIMIFILSYFTIAMNRFAGASWGKAALLTFGFLLAMIGMSAGLRFLVGPLVGGSQSYFPALFALVGVGVWLMKARAHPAGPWLLGAAALFAISLTFRSLDKPFCSDFPLGLHFMWHVMNGAVLFTLIRAVILHGSAPGTRGPRPA